MQQFKSIVPGKYYIKYWDSACGDFLLYSVIVIKDIVLWEFASF